MKVSVLEDITRNITQSSANNSMHEFTELVKSFMQIRKSGAPRTEACGSPEPTARGEESKSLAATNWVLLDKVLDPTN